MRRRHLVAALVLTATIGAGPTDVSIEPSPLKGNTMLRTLTAALFAASMIVAPALAADASSNPAPAAAQPAMTPDVPALITS